LLDTANRLAFLALEDSSSILALEDSSSIQAALDRIHPICSST
jgi:hypothetical protein